MALPVVTTQRELTRRIAEKNIKFVQGTSMSCIKILNLDYMNKKPYDEVLVHTKSFVDERTNVFVVPTPIMVVGGAKHVPFVRRIYDSREMASDYVVKNAFVLLNDTSAEMQGRLDIMGDSELVFSFLKLHLMITSLARCMPMESEFPTVKQAVLNIAHAVRTCFIATTPTQKHTLHAMYSFDAFATDPHLTVPAFNPRSLPTGTATTAGAITVQPSQAATNPLNLLARRFTHTDGAIIDAQTAIADAHIAETGATDPPRDSANLTGLHGTSLFEQVMDGAVQTPFGIHIPNHGGEEDSGEYAVDVSNDSDDDDGLDVPRDENELAYLEEVAQYEAGDLIDFVVADHCSDDDSS